MNTKRIKELVLSVFILSVFIDTLKDLISRESENNQKYHLLSALLLIVFVLHCNHLLPPGPHVPLRHPKQLLGKDGEDGDNTGDKNCK